MVEDTLVILKPDTLSRGLVGICFDRLEKTGLKMVACKMALADKKHLDEMYDENNTQWVEGVAEGTIKALEEAGYNLKEQFGTTDVLPIGYQIIEKLKIYMQDGPIILTIWEGVRAVDLVRKIRGGTVPLFADTGTILGDYSYDNPITSMMKNRSMRNIAHASATVAEANDEIQIWFGKNFQPLAYERTDSIFF